MWEWLDGKKTQLGGIIKILSGVAAILGAVAGIITKLMDPASEIGIGFNTGLTAILAGVYMVGQGFATIGMGHKLEKAREAAIETAVATKATAVATKATATATEEVAASNEAIARKV